MKSTRGARHTGEAATCVKAKAREAASSTSHVQKAVQSISGGKESTVLLLAQEGRVKQRALYLEWQRQPWWRNAHTSGQKLLENKEVCT